LIKLDINQISLEEIKIILRAADPIIAQGGRTLGVGTQSPSNMKRNF